MGPKLKKPPKNSFSFFLDDFVEEQRKKGRNVSKKLAAEECAPLWKKVSKEEKEYYTQLAKANKEKEKVNMDNKYTSLGISYTEKQKEEMKEAEELRKQDVEITDTVDGLSESTLRTHLFYIGHVNYYCKTEEGSFIPAELALSEFNLEDGIRNTYHVLIDPGEIPTGYGFEAKKVSDEIHGIPQPPYDEGEKDYFKILKDIRRFLEPGKMPNSKLPPIYTIENNIKACASVLKFITESQFDEDIVLFRVYPLHKMFFRLKNRCVGSNRELGFPLISNAIAEIEKDVFCFTHGISCAFHKSDAEKYQNCSLSVVKRFVYTICDHCCQYVNVPIIPGKHSRLFADSSRKSTRGSVAGSSLMSSRSSEVGSEYGVPASTYASSLRGVGSSAASILSYREDKRPCSNASAYNSRSEMKPLQLPKTRSKAFHPVAASDVSDMESVTGDSYISDSAMDVDVKKEPEEIEDDYQATWPCVGRGSKIRRPQSAVGATSQTRDTKTSAGRGRLIEDDSD